MGDVDKTKGQLLKELERMRQRIAALESVRVEHKRIERELHGQLEQLERKANQLIGLQKVTASIQRSLDLSEVFRRVAEVIVSNLGYDHAFILALDPKKDVIKGAAFFSKGGSEVVSDIGGIMGRPFQEVQYPAVEGYSRGVDYAMNDQIMISGSLSEILEPPLTKGQCGNIQELLGAKTIVSVPLFVSGRYIGNIIAFTEREYGAAVELEPLKLLGDQAMVAAENARLYDEMVVTLQKLRESEEITRGMLESAATGVYLVKDGKFQYASPLFEHILGYTSDELIGTVATEYIHSEDREATRKKVIEDLKGRSSSPHEFRLLRKDGRTAWVLEKVASIGYKGKRSTIGSIMDITELKMVQESLQASEEKLRAIFESIGDGITVTDLKGRIIEGNDAALRMGGYSKKDIIGKDGFLFVAERDRDRAKKEMRQAFRRGRSAMLDVLFMTKDGGEYDAEVTLSLMKDRFGKPVGMVGIAKDISQRKRMEEALRDSEEKLRFMFESMGDGVVVTDLEGRIIEANRAALAMAGYSRKKDIIGKSGFDFIVPKERARAVDENESNVKAGRGSTAEYTVVDKDGEEFEAEAIGAMLRDSSGRPVGFIVALRDITERKRIEQMKTDFVSLVSHQLKTPVAGVKAYIENMLGGLTGDLSDKQKQYLSEMRDLCVRNYRLISDLLSISMIERGVLSVNIQPVTLKEVVDIAIKDYAKGIAEKGLALKVEAMDPGIVVLADKDKLVEALRNVIDNAIKFTDRGSITVKTEGRGGYGIIEVKDTGTGMADDVLKTLFGREKVLSGGPKAGGGATLGLYIARGFMKLQRGDITATSAIGKGSTFVLKVPMQ